MAPAGEPMAAAETTKVIPKVGIDESGEIPEAADDHQAAHAGAIESLPSGSGLLVVKRGPNAGSRFLLDEDVTTAGRHPESDIFLDDVTVSRNHAVLIGRREGRYVDDLGSLNGTYVNRKRIESHKLQNGDELQVGKYKLTYLEQQAT